MNGEGNIRKLKAALSNYGQVTYTLNTADILTPLDGVELDSCIGKPIQIESTGKIHCTVSGKSIRKTYGDGMSFDAFQSSPLAVESIIRPELSRIHEGIALRDAEWEEAHHNQPHVVYLSLTSGIKVGVTRETNVPSRWIDQGASGAVVLARTPYRQLAGLIEVSMKSHFMDKTNWRKMLVAGNPDPASVAADLAEAKDEAYEVCPPEFEACFTQRIVTLLRTREAFRKIGRVSCDFVGNHPFFYVILVRQTQVLLGRYVTEHGAAIPADLRGADTGSDVVVTRSGVRDQWPKGIERCLIAILQLFLHVLLDHLHGHMARPFDHGLHVVPPGNTGQLTQGL